MKNFSVFLARVMVTSTLIAAAVIAFGLIWFLVTHVGATPGDHLFSGEPKYFRDPLDMMWRALDLSAVGHRRGLIMIGIVLLLLGPVLRVGLAAWGYWTERDRLYAGVSAFVFIVLAVSFFW